MANKLIQLPPAETPTFVEQLSDSLGSDDRDENGKGVGHVSRRLENDNRDAGGHAHDSGQLRRGPKQRELADTAGITEHLVDRHAVESAPSGARQQGRDEETAGDAEAVREAGNEAVDDAEP